MKTKVGGYRLLVESVLFIATFETFSHVSDTKHEVII